MMVMVEILFTTNVVIGVALDVDNGQIYFGKHNTLTT